MMRETTNSSIYEAIDKAKKAIQNAFQGKEVQGGFSYMIPT